MTEVTRGDLEALYDIGRHLRYKRDRLAFAKEAAPALGITEFDPWQQQFLESTSKRILINASRQSGKSTIVSLAALHKALYTPNSLTLVFAPSQDQSMEFFRKVAQVFRLVAPGLDLSVESMTKQGLEIESNGSRIEARPGSEKTSRGRSAHLVIIDEAARVDDELYDSIRPMLAVTSGALYLLSTPYGRRGAFFEAWESGDAWERYRITADQCPRITPEFLEAERAQRPRSVIEREYYCSFDAGYDESIFPPELWNKARDPNAKGLDLSDLKGLGIEGV